MLTIKILSGVPNLSNPNRPLWITNANQAIAIVAAWGENNSECNKKWKQLIAKREKEVAQWIIQFDARKIVYLDIPEQLILYGENATEFIKKRFIDSPTKCENTATIDDTKNSQKVLSDVPESGEKENSNDHTEPEQVRQDVEQNSVSENVESSKSGEQDEIGEEHDENKNDELNAKNTYESGTTFAI